MWIRSQAKDALTNVHHLKILYLHSFGYCIVTDNHVDPNTTTNLGVYSTKEKALKVMDLIEDAIDRQHMSLTAVFQMPQDDEVKENA